MLVSLADTGAVIQQVQSWAKLDLDSGPYITGSVASRHYQLQHGPVDYVPLDVDIITRTPEQTRHMCQCLVDSGAQLVYTEYNTVFNYNLAGLLYQVLEYDASAQDRTSYGDYTITTCSTDGQNYVAAPWGFHDLENWLLRVNNDQYITTLDRERAQAHGWARTVAHRRHRYDKYTRRGFQDPGSQVYQKTRLFLQDYWHLV